MNFSLENFGAGTSPLDLTLYAGVVLVVYVLFKEKIHDLIDGIKDKFQTVKAPSSISDYFADEEFDEPPKEDDPFFELVQSWKHARDLAEEIGADKAVEIADQMFPYLVPKQEDDHE